MFSCRCVCDDLQALARVDDATLRTVVDPEAGIAFRRIKHFSGYSVSSGIRSSAGDLLGGLGF